MSASSWRRFGAALVDVALVVTLMLAVGWVTFQLQPEPTPGKFSGVPRALNTLAASVTAGIVSSVLNEFVAVLRAGVSLGLLTTGIHVPDDARRGPSLLLRWGVTWLLPPMLFVGVGLLGLRTVTLLPDPAALPGPIGGLAADLVSIAMLVGTVAIVGAPLLVVVRGRTLGDRVAGMTPLRRP